RSMAHAALNQWPEAEASARAALAEDPNSVQARRQVIALRLRAEDARAAQALAEEGLRLQPASVPSQQLLLAVVQQTQGLDRALAMADQIAQNPATRPGSLTQRGDLLLAAGRPADAARAFADAHARSPSSELIQREALAWQAAREPEAAMAALNGWLARDPNDASVMNLAAQFDIQAGRTADAMRRLEVVVERQPENSVALNNLAWLIAERGTEADLARARPMAERAYFTLPTPETADTLGWILARTGDTQRAVVLLRQAVNAPRPQGQGVDPDKVFRLAHALRAAGERQEAIALLEPLLANVPAFPQRAAAERLLAELRTGR
uniref:tetratricopeptide repeat protein n=1 Tax=Falsiroseomonas oryzae TaxID=2766473 RepID=UPI0022EA1AF9